jgi:hypothetical protein
MRTWAGLLFLLTGCATTAVDMTEPRRLLGVENSVRIDAQVLAEEVRPGTVVPITYEVTNQRTTPIAIAELASETSYDPDSHTVTVSVGSEVPGNELLPRLIEIAPGEKRAFTASARLSPVLGVGAGVPSARIPPVAFRVKVNFLGDVEPFRQLVGIPERAVADPRLADALFPVWVEKNEIVYTNSVPMRWLQQRRRDPADTMRPLTPSRPRRGE